MVNIDDLGFLVVGVVRGDGVAEGVAGEMSVDFCGWDAFVAEHLLDGTEVGTVLHQLGGETVTEGMGADVLVDACVLNCLLQKHEDIVSREVATKAVNEDEFFFAGLDVVVHADIVDVGIDEVEGAGIDGHPAFLVAFADDLEHLLVGIEVWHLEVYKFRDAETAAVKHFDDDVVAVLVGKAEVEGGLDFGDILVGKDIWQQDSSNRQSDVMSMKSI